MKSNIVSLTAEKPFDQDILAEVEKCAAYNSLSAKESLRLSLLAEELIGMLPNLTQNYDGSFWVENDGKAYNLHVSLNAPVLSVEDMQKAIAVSTSGKNANAVGLGGRIRFLIAKMTAPISSKDLGVIYISTPENGFVGDGLDTYSYAWTLDAYRHDISEKAEEWDELEKSVLAKLADNVIVGVKDSAINITVSKKF